MRLQDITTEEAERMFELYMEEQRRAYKKGDLSDFVIWLGER